LIWRLECGLARVSRKARLTVWRWLLILSVRIADTSWWTAISLRDALNRRAGKRLIVLARGVVGVNMKSTYDGSRTHSQSRTLRLLHSVQWCSSTAVDTQLTCGFLRLVCSQASLYVFLVLELDLLDSWSLRVARRRVTSDGATICLLLPVVCSNALVMLLTDVLWYAFHAEDFYVQGLPVGKRILDRVEGLLVDLLKMDGQA
jgi:hypothetical protein